MSAQERDVGDGGREPAGPSAAQERSPSEGTALRRREESAAAWVGYLRESHERMLAALERVARESGSAGALRSAEVLNRSFRRFQETQERLADELRRERRRARLALPLLLLAAAAVIAAAAHLVRSGRRGLGEEVARLAEERGALRAQQEAGSRALLAAQGRVLDAVDRGLDANRALARENRAQAAEIERLRARLAALENERDGLADQLEQERRRRAEQEEELARTRAELDRARDRLVKQDLLAAAVTGETSSTPVADETSGDGAGDDAHAPTRTGEGEDSSAGPFVEAMNDFLAACGVRDLRLLSCGGERDGELLDVVFEVRTAEGYPVGVERAARCRVEVDEGLLTGAVVLFDGWSTLRGERTRIPPEGRRLLLAAVPPRAQRPAALAAVLRPIPREPESPSAPTGPAEPAPADPGGDAGAATGEGFSALEEALVAADGGRVAFVAGIPEPAGGRDVRVLFYGPSGLLLREVRARRLRVAFDREEGEARLLFEDGSVSTRDRSVPFYRDAFGRSRYTVRIALEAPEALEALLSEAPQRR